MTSYATPTPNKPDVVLDFWFKEISPKQWWTQSDDFDLLIATRFGTLHEAARCCELAHWRDTPDGRLAEVIVLDQFSRNIYRNQAGAFTNDPLALALAQMAISVKADTQLDPARRAFLYMPFMHSESRKIHEDSIALFSQDDASNFLEFARRHKAIIDEFGRYPHRNTILGRISTPAEIEFLKTPGSSF